MVGTTQQLEQHRDHAFFKSTKSTTSRSLLQHHRTLLLDNVDTICATKQYDDVLLPDIGLFIYMVVVPPFVLGQLFLERQDIGSVNVQEPTKYCILWEGWIHPLNKVRPRITQFVNMKHSQSKWSLGQVLVDLGVHLSPTTLYHHGESSNMTTRHVSTLYLIYHTSLPIPMKQRPYMPGSQFHYTDKTYSTMGVLAHWKTRPSTCRHLPSLLTP